MERPLRRLYSRDKPINTMSSKPAFMTQALAALRMAPPRMNAVRYGLWARCAPGAIMRVLHLFANYRWTGPAEPALNLCVALRELGVEADFACNPYLPPGGNKLVETARDRGVEPIDSLRLHKHAHPLKNWLDKRALGALLDAQHYDLIHCHMDNDHRIALGPAQRLGIPVVRSSYHGEGFSLPRRHGPLLKATRFVIEPSQRALDHDCTIYRLPLERLRVIPNAIDTERFDPVRELPDGRKRLNIPADAFLIGIVARMQTHRRYEDFWGAIETVTREHPNARVVVIGRGTKQDSVGMQPVRERKLEDKVHFSGYLTGDDYDGMLRALDVKVYLVPGSDGTCRAVREAMALARPVITSNRGMLGEIVDHGVNGFVTDGSPVALAQRLGELASDRALARRLGQAARSKAESEFALPVQARRVREVYELVVESGRI